MFEVSQCVRCGDLVSGTEKLFFRANAYIDAISRKLLPPRALTVEEYHTIYQL